MNARRNAAPHPTRTGGGPFAVPAALFALFLAFPAQALEIHGEPQQGGLVMGRAAAGERVFLDGAAVPVDREGRFALGFGRDAGPRAEVKAVRPDGATESLTLQVRPREWQVQRIEGLPQDKVTPPKALLERIAADNRAVAKARESRRAVAEFLGGFRLPVAGARVSGVFGSQRILNGEARAPHSGLDLAAPEGTPVVAAAAGVVSLAHPDMVFTGKTVMVDHGLGVQTVYAHLSRIDVTVGERVAAGAPLGRVGATGRATGPHLHWGASWLDRRLDPEALLALPQP